MTRGNDDHPQEFSPKLLGVWRTPPSPLPRALLATLVVLLAGLIIGAFLGRLDIVVRAQGKLVPRTRLKIVQPFQGGRVVEIRVREGQPVRAGQALMRMDSSLSKVDTAELARQLALTKLQWRRVDAELADKPFEVLPDDSPDLLHQVQAQYQADRLAHRDALRRQQATIERARRELAGARQVRDKLQEMRSVYRKTEAAYVRLGKQGNVAQLDVLERRGERIKAERDLRQALQSIAGLEGTIAEARAKLASLRSEYRRKLVEQRVKLNDQAEQLAAKSRKQAYRNRLLVLKAPQDGIVKDIATHTVGYVVPSGTVLMTLVPAGEPLQARVSIDNRDIGFVRPGQMARLKLSAYPFQRFGAVAATVHVISPDALGTKRSAKGDPGATTRGAYWAVLDLDQQYLTHDGERLQLRPGMAVTAEIKLGERSVMEYLLSPIERTLDYAAKER